MKGLEGVRVALLEGRMTDELATLVRRHGGEPHCVPAVREQQSVSGEEEVAALLGVLVQESSPVVVLSTGVGVEALFQAAERLGRKSELLERLHRATLVCRGPKPHAALRKEGLEPSIRVKEPYTTEALIEALAPLELEGRCVVLLHYGERNLPLLQALAGRRARIQETLLYEWKLPEDLGPLQSLVQEIIERQVGAIAFTSQVQVRHLFQVATEQGRAEALISALRNDTVVAAVGPTCASALEASGVTPHVVPERPKMGAMIVSLARFISEAGASRESKA
ncbi:uroporphyrinogen-III synthase [Archangium violaceum]|uniref:uroporphyrinogen-III synthase n=1 Tax=Archangium violaceum TaxID=83451 RepID=UPI002B319F69|nr:uroporphyrinogen-III synthase [Archangium violaceum]